MSRILAGELVVVRVEEGTPAAAFGSTPLWEGVDAIHGAIDALHPDELLPVVEPEDRRGWVRVLSPRGRIGWVHREFVERVSAQSGGHSVE